MFETGRGHGKVNRSRLTILQRLTDDFYLGKLHVNRDFVEGRSGGSTSKYVTLTSSSIIDLLNLYS